MDEKDQTHANSFLVSGLVWLSSVREGISLVAFSSAPSPGNDLCSVCTCVHEGLTAATRTTPQDGHSVCPWCQEMEGSSEDRG